MDGFYSLGLIGYPLEHSFSPIIHQAGLEQCGLRGKYVLYALSTNAKGKNELVELIGSVRTGMIKGLNVTIPYKEEAMKYVDELTPVAKRIGAINTIYARGGELIGENTDVKGFREDFRRVAHRHIDLDMEDENLPQDRKALVIGAGGAARAVVYELRRIGWNVLVSARRFKQAEKLVESMKRFVGVGTLSMLAYSRASLEEISPDLDLIVNATPLGMYPKVETSPWPISLAMPSGSFVYDLVYNPKETTLLRIARKAGIPCAGGIGMLVEQAAIAFELWTGCTNPREAMRSAVHEKLSRIQ